MLDPFPSCGLCGKPLSCLEDHLIICLECTFIRYKEQLLSENVGGTELCMHDAIREHCNAT